MTVIGGNVKNAYCDQNLLRIVSRLCERAVDGRDDSFTGEGLVKRILDNWPIQATLTSHGCMRVAHQYERRNEKFRYSATKSDISDTKHAIAQQL